MKYFDYRLNSFGRRKRQVSIYRQVTMTNATTAQPHKLHRTGLSGSLQDGSFSTFFSPRNPRPSVVWLGKARRKNMSAKFAFLVYICAKVKHIYTKIVCWGGASLPPKKTLRSEGKGFALTANPPTLRFLAGILVYGRKGLAFAPRPPILKFIRGLAPQIVV